MIKLRFVVVYVVRFQYMAMSDERQRIMPTAQDRKKGKVLDYPEAVLLTHPKNSFLRGEVISGFINSIYIAWYQSNRLFVCYI